MVSHVCPDTSDISAVWKKAVSSYIIIYSYLLLFARLGLFVFLFFLSYCPVSVLLGVKR